MNTIQLHLTDPALWLALILVLAWTYLSAAPTAQPPTDYDPTLEG